MQKQKRDIWNGVDRTMYELNYDINYLYVSIMVEVMEIF